MIQNDDIKVRFTLTSNDVAVIISTLNDYQIYLYFHTGTQVKKLLATYKKNGTGVGAIAVDDDAQGKLTIVVPRTLTKTLSEGKLYAEVKVQLDATSDYIDSLQNAGANGLLITEVVSSASPNALV